MHPVEHLLLAHLLLLLLPLLSLTLKPLSGLLRCALHSLHLQALRVKRLRVTHTGLLRGEPVSEVVWNHVELLRHCGAREGGEE